MGALAEFTLALLKERQREGVPLAKQRGVYKGRQKSLSAQDVSADIRAQDSSGCRRDQDEDRSRPGHQPRNALPVSAQLGPELIL
jgi:DNA invertase Pin-like site-specific DNA recombinase